MIREFLKNAILSFYLELVKICAIFVWALVVALANRGFVKESFPTGVLSVDAAIPVGRGQRQLVLGDRGKGKSTFALDSLLISAVSVFLRQSKETDAIATFSPAVFISVGKRKSEVLKVFSVLSNSLQYLKNTAALVIGGSSDVAPFQWFAPFIGVGSAEYFLHSGLDSFVIFNDLSRHANAYRQISLLLRRPPAREAFPGDIFFLHARLLERCAKSAEIFGAGSCTAFPLVETQEGELSAYIPTNIISITDGQILLDSRLFNRGLQPAINIGLSVSRIGSSAQPTKIKESTGALRLELALYRELEKNRQFKDQLDSLNRELLFHGDFLTVYFQQPKNAPVSVGAAITILVLTADQGFTAKFLNRVEEKIYGIRIKQFKVKIHRNLFDKISRRGVSAGRLGYAGISGSAIIGNSFSSLILKVSTAGTHTRGVGTFTRRLR